MLSVLDKNIVLVLNKNWQAINIITPAEAFCHLYSGSATALDIQGDEFMVPTPWSDWVNLPVREGDFEIRTVASALRVPSVIVLAHYAKVPMCRPSYSARSIRERDGNRCQYSGQLLQPDEGNIDHVVPRSRGGEDSWDNCVLAARQINSRKGNRTPEEAGLALIRPPRSPKAVPVTKTLQNPYQIPDWKPFLGR